MTADRPRPRRALGERRRRRTGGCTPSPTGAALPRPALRPPAGHRRAARGRRRPAARGPAAPADGRVEPLPARPLARAGRRGRQRAARARRRARAGHRLRPGPPRRRAARGRAPALGVDLSPVAVRDRARPRRRRDPRLGLRARPRAGAWGTALLLDGNIGIGGEPAALLRRARELLAPGGAVLAELDPPGAWSGVTRVRLEASGRRQRVVRVGARRRRRGSRRWLRRPASSPTGPCAQAERWFAALRRR